MSLESYFTELIKKVEESEMHNQGTDKNGFYKPTKTIVLRHLNLIRDLHKKPNAKAMIQSSWAKIVEELPPEWLVLKPDDKKELQEILK